MKSIIVCGGRDYTDKEKLYKVLDEKINGEDVLIVQGGARGADSLAKRYAIDNKLPYVEFPADWGKHGKAAGYIRNSQMLNSMLPIKVIAFPGGKGTANMAYIAERAGVYVDYIEGD